MKKILVYLDSKEIEASLDLVFQVEQIFAHDDVEIHGVGEMEIQEQMTGYFDELHVYNKKISRDVSISDIADVVEQVYRDFSYEAIFFPATEYGKHIAPIVSYRLQIGIVADVIGMTYDNNGLVMTRTAFDGKLMAQIISVHPDERVILTVRASGKKKIYNGNHSAQIHKIEIISYKPSVMHHIKAEVFEGGNDIRDAEVLVAGGGGVGKRIDCLKALAKELNGEVAASRRLVDTGVAPRNIQVGQSGKTVYPKLYLALGIHGALQHVTGMQGAEEIISVNCNKYAPMCSLASIVVEGDAVEFMEKLTNYIQLQGGYAK